MPRSGRLGSDQIFDLGPVKPPFVEAAYAIDALPPRGEMPHRFTAYIDANNLVVNSLL
jgi:hypothetical protein